MRILDDTTATEWNYSERCKQWELVGEVRLTGGQLVDWDGERINGNPFVGDIGNPDIAYEVGELDLVTEEEWKALEASVREAAKEAA